MRRTTIGIVIALIGFTLAPAAQRSLDFDSRVSCQRNIERFYHLYRIGGLSFDEAVPEDLLVEKVEIYLKQSLALEQFWNAPITADQLVTELERISTGTKAPNRLIDLYRVLGNDAFLIQECLVRPIMSERLARGFLIAETGDPESWDVWWKGVERDLDPLLVTAVADDVTLPLPALTDPAGEPTPHGSSQPPSARQTHTAVWTDTEMIVWGGSGPGSSNTGGRYDPATGGWTATSTANAPAARERHTAVWTDERMIVWGGRAGTALLGSGSAYDPGNDSWASISALNEPEPRFSHSAVWTGSEMIVWGGAGQGKDATERAPLKTGGRYDPVTDSWSRTKGGVGLRPRFAHRAVWTGSHMIVWGGEVNSKAFNNGRRYDPVADRWRSLTKAGAPEGRFFHSATWADSQMIVWGGSDTDVGLASGGRYIPADNSWSATTLLGPPEARVLQAAVWTGSQLIVWGGNRPGASTLSTGGRYDPLTDAWAPTSIVNVPSNRSNHTAVWTGDEMIVWGGRSGSAYRGDGGRYDPAGDSWIRF